MINEKEKCPDVNFAYQLSLNQRLIKNKKQGQKESALEAVI